MSIALLASVMRRRQPTLVGATTEVVAVAGTSNINLPGPPIQGDIAIVAVACDNTLDGIADGILSAGYTNLNGPAGASPGRHVAYKAMGASPDTQVQVTADPAREAAVAIQVWRGLGSSLDVAVQSVTGASGMPDPPSATTVTNGAVRFIIGMLDDESVTDVTAPSEFGNLTFVPTNAPSTQSATVMMATKVEATAGALNPAAFGGTGTAAWAAIHFAFPPV